MTELVSDSIDQVNEADSFYQEPVPKSKSGLPKILLIDSQEDSVQTFKELVADDDYQLIVCSKADKALAQIKKEKPFVVLCNMGIEGISGPSLLESIREASPACMRVAIAGSEDFYLVMQAINFGHIHRALKFPLEALAVKVALSDMLHQWNDNERQSEKSKQKNLKIKDLEALKKKNALEIRDKDREIKQARSQIDQAEHKIQTLFLTSIKSLMNLMESRYPALVAHCKAVAEISRLLAKEVGASDEEVKNIYHAGLLHDIGKLSLPDSILLKPISSIDGESRSSLMKHPEMAFDALKALPGIDEIACYIKHHHERFDGKGFPDGLAGTTIPLGARIIGLAEDFDELQRGWVAGRKLTEQEALRFVKGSVKKRYDPLIVAKMPAALEKMRAAPKPHEQLVSGGTLTSGMVITRDLLSPEGHLLVAIDGVVTPAVIKHIQECEAHHKVLMKIYVHRDKYGKVPTK